ncbi:MAG: hypothetical protein ACRDJI_04845 [Actinomycetota bacterium]
MAPASGFISAHGVGTVYELPLPLSLYLGGAAATVLASFGIRAVVERRRPGAERVVAGPRAALVAVEVFRVAALVTLVLAVVFAIIEPHEGLTVAPLLFWIGLVVGTTVLSSIVAGLWERGNPWVTIQNLYLLDQEDRPRNNPPWWVGPLLVYGLFWFELVSGRGFEPGVILLVFLGYSIYTLGLRAVWGWDTALTDPFAILFGFAGRVAPFKVDDRGILYRGPVAGLDQPAAMPRALFAAVFVLLGSTTLDNVRETVGWFNFLADTGLDELPDMLVGSLALLAFTLPFFVPFAVAVWVARRWFAEPVSWSEASRRFGWSLIPIGIAYVLAHNMPLLMTGLPLLINEIFDFTGRELIADYSPSPKLVWFLEIGLIVGGHILGVLSAHRIALRMSGSHAAAVKSHTTLTLLMGAFTIGTLWLLSLPLVVD